VRYRLPFAVSFVALLTACAVGPNFETPAKPTDSSFESTALPPTAPVVEGSNVPIQVYSAGQDIPAQWWTLFHSPALNSLIEKALKANPDIAAAEASLRIANENLDAGNSILFPSITGGFNSTRQKTAGATNGGHFSGSIYTLHNASISGSYLLDVFGGSRRAVEELEAKKDYQEYERQAAYLTLTANVVTAAIQEASLRGQIDETYKIILSQTRQLNLYKKQLALGGIDRSTVLEQENTLAQTRTTLPPLEKQLSQIRHQISVYCGETPSHEPQAVFTLDSLDLPKELPVILPSKLVEQRPDIRAAEATLHSASAAIGVAIANRLPQFNLSASIGDVAGNISKMFIPGTGIWSLGADITQTLFDAGKLQHEEGSAEAEYDLAAAQYRKAVLVGFQDVADALRAIDSDTAELKYAIAAEQTAVERLKLARQRFAAGAISSFEMLSSEVTEQQSRVARVKAEGQRYADTAALFQALGGGWWNAPPISKDSVEDQTDATKPQSQTAEPDKGSAPTIQMWRHE